MLRCAASNPDRRSEVGIVGQESADQTPEATARSNRVSLPAVIPTRKKAGETPEAAALRLIEEAERAGATRLDLAYLRLTSLPKAIGRLGKLSKLFVQNNELTALPEEIGGLANLTELHLSANLLTSLPVSIGRLANLKMLNLFRNELTSLPEAIGGLTNLTTLTLSQNRLSSLPEAMGRLTNLTELFLHDNLLRLPPEILGPDWNRVDRGVADPKARVRRAVGERL
jgi:hypothetical protein